MPLSVKVISTTDAFADLKDEWNKLLNSSEATVFQSWEWQWSWWQNFKRGRRLFILLVYDDELIGIAPFCKSFSFLELPMVVVSFLGGVITDYNDFISKSEREREVVEAIFAYLKTLKDWEVLDLNEIRENSPHLKAIREILQKTGSFEKQELIKEVAYRLLLPSNWEDLMVSFSKKFQWNLNYCTRRLLKNYQVKVIRVENEDEIEPAILKFFELHNQRWLKKKIPTLLFSKKYQNFHRQVSLEFFKAGRLALYFLYLNNEPVATLYGFEFKGVFYYYLSGFNPDWASLSVSTVLTGFVIKDAIKNGFQIFDFLRGEEQHKLRWGCALQKNLCLLVAKKKKTANLIARLIAYESLLLKKTKGSLKERIS